MATASRHPHGMPVPVRTVDAAHAINGERPGWDDLRQRLYWVDMRRPALYAHDPAGGRGGRSWCWQMPAWIGCYGIARDGRLVVALRTGLQLFDPADGSLRPVAAAPYDARRFCFNDGRCDRQGRLVVGAMYHPLDTGDARPDAPQRAPLWRYDGAGRLAPLALPPVRIANGLAFSPDGRTLYHADTPAKTVWACDYDPATGTADNQRVFARIDEGGEHGGPDGATVDRDGFYLCAVFGAGCLLRFDPDGRLERRIELPVRYPTMPAFGGADRATLYVTSASFPDRQRHEGDDPLAGGLFALPAPAPGLPTDYIELGTEAAA